MSLTDQPFEIGDPRAAPAPEASGGVLPSPEVDLGPREETSTPGAPHRTYSAEDVVPLLQELARHEREVFEEVVAGATAQWERTLFERTESLHDPQRVMTVGIIYGAVGVLLALVALVAIGLLFLHGLQLIRG